MKTLTDITAYTDYIEQLNALFESDMIDDVEEGFCIGHSYFCNIKKATDQALSGIVEYELIPLLKEYWFDEPVKVKDWMHQLFTEYRKAVYLYAFASYAEVLTLKNYDGGFLTSVKDLIRSRLFDYLSIYSSICDQIDRLTDKTVGSVFSRVSATVSKKTGEFIEKTPLGKTQLDENLGAMGATLDKLSASRRDKNIKMFYDDRGAFIAPFLEGLQELDTVFNHGDELYIDSTGVYVISDQAA